MTPTNPNPNPNPNPNQELKAAEFYKIGCKDLAYRAPEEMHERARDLFSETYIRARSERDFETMTVACDALRSLADAMRENKSHKS